METNQYQLFKNWLISNGKIEICPNAVDYVYTFNRILKKHICESNLFDLIESERYFEIYKLRHHYKYRREPFREWTIRFAFEYKGKEFSKFEEYEAEKTFERFSKKTTLFIHQGNIACLRFKHPIADVSASIATASEEPLIIHASYCKRCGIVFIKKSYYKQLRRQHKFLVANFCELSDDGYSPIPPGTMAAESPLMLCGYSVKEDGLSEYYRHLLLSNIVYNGILNKTEIINYLEHFLSFNGSRDNMGRANYKWQSDLNFIRNLDLDSHPTVTVTQIRPYKRQNVSNRR